MSEFLCVEKPFMQQLKKLNWEIKLFEDDKPKFTPNLTLRRSFDEVLIESRLKESLKKLNEWLDESQIHEAVQEIKRIGLRKGLVQANMDVYNLLLEPISFKNENVEGSKPESIKIIDFEKPDNNDFLAMNQFRVDTPGTIRDYIVPDVVLFINGLPIAIVECKYPSQVEADAMEEAITQLKRYSNSREEVKEREGNERLFHYNQLMIATTFDEARIGTITSDYGHYLEWKDTYPFKTNKDSSSQEKLITGALTRENLLDIIRNFTIFTETEKGRIKIVARYHQFRAVKKVIERLQNEESPDKRSGVVWHTQGSGKSMSMVFLIRKIRTIADLKQQKIVIVTDRTDLETQLKETAGLAEEPQEIKNTKQLLQDLKTDTSNLVMVMAQKFLKRVNKRSSEDELPDYEEFPVLNRSENILMLVDEAHRSQSGTFGDNIVGSLPNSSRIAFTGTPLVSKKVKQRTYQRFGRYIDTYKMKEAIDDGAIVKIKYEGKAVKSRIKNKEKFDETFEDMFTDKSKEELIAIKKKYGTKGNILESKKRINAIAKDLVKHYFENIFDNGFKAQVVASTRFAAIRYKDAIDNAVKEYVAEYAKTSGSNKDRINRMKFCTSCVRIDWGYNDPPSNWGKDLPEDTTKWAIEGKKLMGEDNVNFKSGFDLKKPHTSIAFLIVKDMLLTGFDAPIEQVMYVDKRMTDHTLLQAIARVNRVMKGKDVGRIVDYYGITNHLGEALEAYRVEDLELDEVFSGIQTELPILKYRYDQLIKLFKKKKVKQIEEYVNYKIQDTYQQLSILDECVQVLEDIKIRADFSFKFKLFLKSMDVLLSKPFSKPYIRPMKAFGHIHKRAQSKYRDDSINILGAGRKVRTLIDEYLISVGINPKIAPVDIISDKFDEEISKNTTSRAQASEMEHAIRKHCKIKFHSDPAYYKKISEKLDEILQRFKNNWDGQVKYLKDLKQEVKEGRQAVDSGLDPEKHGPFYDLMKEIAFKGERFPEKDKQDIKRLTVEIVDAMAREVGKVGFWGNSTKEKHLRAEIDDLILYSGIDKLIKCREKIKTDFMKLAKNRSKEILK